MNLSTLKFKNYLSKKTAKESGKKIFPARANEVGLISEL